MTVLTHCLVAPFFAEIKYWKRLRNSLKNKAVIEITRTTNSLFELKGKPSNRKNPDPGIANNVNQRIQVRRMFNTAPNTCFRRLLVWRGEGRRGSARCAVKSVRRDSRHRADTETVWRIWSWRLQPRCECRCQMMRWSDRCAPTAKLCAPWVASLTFEK